MAGGEKKSTKITEMYQLEYEFNKLVKLGMRGSNIRAKIHRSIPEDSLDIDMVDKKLKDLMKKHPNYSLIQTLVSSKLVIDKREKNGKIYYFDDKTRMHNFIDKIHLNSLIKNFDFSSNVYHCNFDYEPYTQEKLFKNIKNGEWVYNLYEPAGWESDKFFLDSEIEPLRELPELYEKYFKHFTNGDEDSYTYVLDWLAHSLRDRNPCILTAIGNQGVGKGVLGEIMSRLFGDNYDWCKGSAFLKEFNGKIKNKRMFYIDELMISNVDQEDSIKVLINPTIEIEKKGVDSETIVNYASYYISSNNVNSLKLRGDDRRFSIIELSPDNLKTVLTTEEIGALFTDENIGLLARYLWFREYDPERLTRVFISSRTEVIRAASLKQWEEYLLEEVCVEYAGKTVVAREITDLLTIEFGSRNRFSRAALQRVLEAYPKAYVLRKNRMDSGKRVWNVEFPKEPITIGGD